MSTTIPPTQPAPPTALTVDQRIAIGGVRASRSAARATWLSALVSVPTLAVAVITLGRAGEGMPADQSSQPSASSSSVSTAPETTEGPAPSAAPSGAPTSSPPTLIDLFARDNLGPVEGLSDVQWLLFAGARGALEDEVADETIDYLPSVDDTTCIFVVTTDAPVAGATFYFSDPTPSGWVAAEPDPLGSDGTPHAQALRLPYDTQVGDSWTIQPFVNLDGMRSRSPESVSIAVTAQNADGLSVDVGGISVSCTP